MMLEKTANTIRRNIEKFFPPACAGCDRWATVDTAFCEVCRLLAPRLTSPCCARCGVPLETFDDAPAPSECSRCTTTRPAFDRVVACWEYDDAVADAIRRIKYGGDLPALRALSRGARRWFHDTLKRLSTSTCVVVPSHPAELRDRGFHVPTLTVHWVGAGDALQQGLEKTRRTPQQAGLAWAERRTNVRNAFRYTGNHHPVPNEVVLFDDVLTTGATADAAASALKSAGCEDVTVAVLARARSPRATAT